MTSKKLFRPESSGDSQADSLLKISDEFLLNNERLVAESSKVFTRVQHSKVIQFHINTRRLPIPMERFVQIEWPSLDDENCLEKIFDIVREEEINPRYTLAKALDFYERLYLLAVDIKSLGLSQPIGLIDVSVGVYELIYGQRRFMATLWAAIPLVDSTIYDIQRDSPDAASLIKSIQDSENEQRQSPLFVDRFETKHKKYLNFKESNPFAKKGEMIKHLGLTREEGYSILKVFDLPDDDERKISIFSQVEKQEITSFRAFRDIDVEKKRPKPRVKKATSAPEHDVPTIRNLGFVIYKATDLTLVRIIIKALAEGNRFSSELKSLFDRADLNDPKTLSAILQKFANEVYHEEDN